MPPTDTPLSRLRLAEVPESPPRVRGAVFVYSGQGGFWHGMGRDLILSHRVVRSTIAELDGYLSEFGWPGCEGASLLNELTRDEAGSRLARTEVVQPCLFALQVSLTRVWRLLGVRPAAVVGHSLGELAAAWSSGVLSLRETTRVLCGRLRGQLAINGQGGMMAVALDEAALRAHPELSGGVVIAAHNGPRSVTVAGTEELLTSLSQRLRKARVPHRRLPIDGAYHSPLIDTIRDGVLAELGQVEARPERLPFYSTMTGTRLSAEALGADYWHRNMVEPVRFYPAVQALVRDGYRNFVEIGAHPIHARELREALAEEGVEGTLVPTLDRNEPDDHRVLDSLQELLKKAG